MFTTIALLMLSQSPQRDAIIVVDDSRQSKILQSEWTREWPLSELRGECQRHYRIRFIQRIDSPCRCTRYPSVVVDSQAPKPIKSFAASGCALTALHKILIDDADEWEEIVDREGKGEYRPARLIAAEKAARKQLAARKRCLGRSTDDVMPDELLELTKSLLNNDDDEGYDDE